MEPKRVLYVEDSESDAFFMRRAFQRASLPFELDVVGDGRAALAYLEGALARAGAEAVCCPVLVLLDLNLPVLNGFDVLQWIRRQPALSALPVVVFSASHFEVDRLRCLALGAVDYRVKPNDMTSLPELLQDLAARFLLKA